MEELVSSAIKAAAGARIAPLPPFVLSGVVFGTDAVALLRTP